MTKKVFLGGTCNNSKWRELIIPLLTIEYFNPVVPDWNENSYKEELKQRKECDYCLYVITPKMTGVYSIAEVVDDSNKNPRKTVLVFLDKDEDKEFSMGQKRSNLAVSNMVRNNGGKVFTTLTAAAGFLNEEKKIIKNK